MGTYSWSGPGLVTDVQAWLDGAAENDGWTIVADETVAPGAKRFYTREWDNAALRPALHVTFTPPAAYGACCLGNSCIQASPGACDARGGTYQGDSSACSAAPCTQPAGACCVPGSGCMLMSMAECAASGGTYNGDGTPCSAGLCSAALTPFVDALPIPAVAQPVSGSAGGAAAYSMAVTRLRQRLHRDLPLTTVWGYNAGVGVAGASFPGPTIEAARDLPVTVTWTNNLRQSFDGTGPYLQHHDLPIDLCLHGPNMYGDLPRTVVHLHGAHAPADSDGYPDVAIAPGGTQTFTYPNHQPAATLWYHDHALGITAQNVYIKDKDYAVGTFPFTALGKAIATRSTDGFAKIIRGLPRGEILGAHIMGDQATELISELTLARRLEATTEEIICSMHAHPTMHEATREAALASEGRVIHT